jgi:hypothetical protein
MYFGTPLSYSLLSSLMLALVAHSVIVASSSSSSRPMARAKSVVHTILNQSDRRAGLLNGILNGILNVVTDGVVAEV